MTGWILFAIIIGLILMGKAYKDGFKAGVKKMSPGVISAAVNGCNLILLQDKLDFVERLLPKLDKESQAYSELWDIRNDLVISINVEEKGKTKNG